MIMKNAIWIGSGLYNDRKNSLPPEVYVKEFEAVKPAKAFLTVSALGIYNARIDGQDVSDVFFAPGDDEYRKEVKAHTYDVTGLLQEGGRHRIEITVANGWYLGTIGGRNNNYGKHRGLIAELALTDEKGNDTFVSTDRAWQYTTDSAERFADFYNGETIDHRRTERDFRLHPVICLDERKEKLPALVAGNACQVRCQMTLQPVFLHCVDGKMIYDFRQNHAGLLLVRVRAHKGDTITIRHGEILDNDGGLFTKNLRSARATLTLVCGSDEEEVFDPRFTFMGFRYVEVSVTDREGKKCLPEGTEWISLESRVLSSDAKRIGDFECAPEPVFFEY
jgi:alpha-L-rhamnosidase